MGFLREPSPAYGQAQEMGDGVIRLVAANPGPMTYHGTNTWLLEGADGFCVIDPGPDDAAHVAAIMAASGGKVSRILLTHTHPDHVGAAAALARASGAPIAGYHAPWLAGFTPDIALRGGEVICGLAALHTPGHASDHLCFARADGALFSGDHVMSWNTSIVSPPDGDMAAYMDGLRLLLTRQDRIYFCGHGPVLAEPQALVRALLIHRIQREAAVADCLGTAAIAVSGIVDRLYAEIDPRLKPAAARSVLAHLHKLRQEGRAQQQGDGWMQA